ncbi:hypothetical protein [Acidocella aromatica]|uniref:Uracil-DNA glycosylase-like domain-containing protein n=1 Tax=Acidocella aromatica TaxID=1303579 RepID=A0A840VN33_9PROT|nr:hypothetical protein [Acidocella aromatica]MBB5373001.1 hypothetical protein [Acidocella aromatica]
MDLTKLQHQWIELYYKMSRAPDLVAEKLAAPFLSTLTEENKQNHSRNVLYIGKATAKDWYKPNFEAEPTVQARHQKTCEFLQWIEGGGSTSAFWRLGKRFNDLMAQKQTASLSNLIWTNIAKIGVDRGNPSRTYLRHQQELAILTLIEEIKGYKPKLIVFVSSDYAKDIVREVFQSFDADQDDPSWIKNDEHIWWRPALGQLPFVACVGHPQRKTCQTLDTWFSTIRTEAGL